MRTSVSLLCAAAIAAVSCSADKPESPRPSSVEPSTGLASTTTKVVIHGDGFLALPSGQQSGGGAVVDARHRAWLGDAELDGVTWIDAHTLEAVVPAGLPAGSKQLLVENAFGQRGALENAFTVIRATPQTPAALAAAVAVEGSPTTVLVGQPLNVTLTVSNTGQAGGNVTAVQPSATPASAATCGAPSPAPPQTIAGLGTRTFTWTCTALTAGSLSLAASVSGIDVNGGATIQATAPGNALSVQLPAELTATIAASRGTVDVGQVVTATFTLTNGGASTANVTAVTPARSGSAAATCGAASPGPSPIAAGASRTFTWTCTPSTAGELVLSGTATGTDAISGGPLSATPATPASVNVQTAAALAATLGAVPTSVVVGQAVALTLTVQNAGGASAVVSSVVPLRSGAAAICGAVSPTTPQTIAGGTSATFTWSCTPSAQGTLTLDASVSASDANTGTASSPPVAPVNVTVLAPAALTATIGAAPSTVNVGQTVNVTFTVTNGGTATANITAITPVLSGGTAAGTTTCGAASPAPAPIAAGRSSTFTWTCSSTAPGTLSLSGEAAGTDAISGAALSATPATPAPATVQTPAVLSPSLAANMTNAFVGQPITYTLTIANSGGASAVVSSVSAQPSGTATASCGAVLPATPVTIAGGGPSATFGWTCTPSSAGTLTLSATVVATDANSGADASPAVTPVDVMTQVLLTATLTPDPPTVVRNTPATLTLVIENSRDAVARVDSIVPVKGGNISCSAVTPLPPLDVPAASTATFIWTCTPTKPNNYTLGATVHATDVSTNLQVTIPVATVTITAT
jgi:uncharacterized repeat protein (TIGR01451 family)